MDNQNSTTDESSVEADEQKVIILYIQSPVTCTHDDIRSALIKTNNDIAKALDILWEIPEPPPKPFKFLDDVREIADECDRLMDERDMKNKYYKTINSTENTQ